MRKRWIWTLTAVFAVILLSVGSFYMLGNQKHQRVKQRYDIYMAQYDKLVADAGYLPRLDEDTEYSNALDNLSDKVAETENYLKKHAPHLLRKDEKSIQSDPLDNDYITKARESDYLTNLRETDPEAAAELEAKFAEIEAWNEKLKSGDYTDKEYIDYLRKRNPEAAAKLESALAQNQREYESSMEALDAELALAQQELLDHQADMVAFEKRREERRQSRLEFEKKSAEDSAKLDAFIDKLRSHLILDENGKVIGIKDSSIFNTERSKSGAPSDPADSTLPIDVLPEKEDIENDSEESREISPTIPDDPRLLQQELVREMSRLNVGFYEKYPDVALQSLLSETEFTRLFPIEAHRNELAQRSKALQSTYAREIDAFLQRIPRETRHTLLQQVQDDLTQKWDRDFAKSVIKQLQQNME